MFDIFGKKDKKKKKDASKSKDSSQKTKADLIKEAQANARKARAEIGQENIEKIARELGANLPDKPAPSKSDAQRAREELEQMDKGHVADHLRYIIDEDK